MAKYYKQSMYLPVFMVKKLHDYVEDGVFELGMMKMYFLGKMLQKAIEQDIMGVYNLKRKNELSSSSLDPAPEKTEPEPEPEPEWKAKWRAMVAERNARKAEAEGKEQND